MMFGPRYVLAGALSIVVWMAASTACRLVEGNAALSTALDAACVLVAARRVHETAIERVCASEDEILRAAEEIRRQRDAQRPETGP